MLCNHDAFDQYGARVRCQEDATAHLGRYERFGQTDGALATGLRHVYSCPMHVPVFVAKGFDTASVIGAPEVTA